MKYQYHCEVNHLDDTLSYDFAGGFGPLSPKFPEDYNLVAKVDCTDVEDAFFLTQNIDKPWTENQRIRSTYGQRFRSTSVGDVVVVHGPDGRKVKYCAPFGWKDMVPARGSSATDGGYEALVPEGGYR